MVKKRMPLRPISVCRHEAGHAVMAELCGHRVERVVITKSGGYCEHSWPENKPVDYLRLGMVIVAGHVCDFLWNRSCLSKWPKDDFAELIRLGFRDRSLLTIFNIARGVLEENEEPVMAVAKALKKTNLTGDEVRAIIDYNSVES